MSATLATIADSLIDFILSLLQDPAEAAKFDNDPEGTLAGRGLSGITAADVCAVAPVVAERPQVVQVYAPHPSGSTSHNSVVHEISTITHNLSWIDDRDTVVDQSTNQNIWAAGDVTQNFDQSAVVGSGDGSTVAGQDLNLTQTQDDSSHITAGNDVNLGNTTTDTATTDSNNTSTDNSTVTDNSTSVDATDALNSTSTDVVTDDSHDSSAASYTDASTDVDANSMYDTHDSALIDDTTTNPDL
jgi:hypothetical protein